jgi:hypothetical protein
MEGITGYLNMKEMGIYIKMGFVTSESWDPHHCALFNVA